MPSEQLTLIFSILGSPSPEDVAEIRNVRAREYLENQVRPQPPKDLNQMFPSADSNAREMIRELLLFSATKRITVENALQMPFVEQYYVSSKQADNILKLFFVLRQL